jgi:hypothetical protein
VIIRATSENSYQDSFEGILTEGNDSKSLTIFFEDSLFGLLHTYFDNEFKKENYQSLTKTHQTVFYLVKSVF